MILSFRDPDTEVTFHGKTVRRIPPDIRARARRKLDLINAAAVIEDLRVPPGNQLEALHGDRKGQYSIRINDQWRVCFRFAAGNALDVEIVDYH
jgi:toxin HigB-1